MNKFELELGVEDYEKEWKQDLPFDKYDLDNEYTKHPMTYMKWVKIYAGAAAARKDADDATKQEELKLFLQGKKEPAEFGFDAKPTDSAIKAYVSQEQSVKDLQAEAIRVYEIYKCLEYCIRAFEHKKELMKGEGDLWANQYYSKPTVFETAKKEVKEDQQRVDTTKDFKKGIQKSKRGIRKPLT